MSWEGVLDTAFWLRGEDLFLEMLTEPDRVHHLFDCVTETMIDGARRVYERQRLSGVDVQHFSVSNCFVNTLSGEHCQKFLLDRDRRIADEFGLVVHGPLRHRAPSRVRRRGHGLQPREGTRPVPQRTTFR